MCCNFGLLYLTQSLIKVTPNNFSLLFLFRKVSSKYSKNYIIYEESLMLLKQD